MSSVTIKERFLTPQECKDIVDYSIETLSLEPGLVKNQELIEKVRKSKIAFHSFDENFNWLFKRIKGYIDSTYILKGYRIKVEPILQFTKYATGEYYNWHQDDAKEGPAADRFCSMVIQLSDNYVGGDLQYKQNGIHIFNPGLGSLFTFPSFYSHRVTEVLEGTRYSLVGWFKLIPIQGNIRTTI